MSDFKILDDESHIKLRKGQYCGEDSQVSVNGYFLYNNKCEYDVLEINPALCKIINEIIDNSVDAHIRSNYKSATKIDIAIKPTLDSFEVTVSDNGTGIPVVKIESENEYQPVLCWGRARSGESFNNQRVTAGSNGIGSFLTYVFSETFIGETCDGVNKLVFKKPSYVNVTPCKKQGTKVTFIPDLSHFSVLMNQDIFKSHCEFIRQRLINLSLCYPKISFTFNDENVSLKSIDVFANSISNDNVIQKNEKYNIIVASTADCQEFRHHNYTNGLYNSKGGSVVDYVCNQLCTQLTPLIKKKYKIDVSNSQIKNNLFIGVYAIDLIDIKFDSQSKERVTNSSKEVSAYFNDDFGALAKKVMANEAIIEPIVKSILFKKAQAENLELARQQKKLKNEKVVNHIPATYKDRDECAVFICEGISSLSNFINVKEDNKLGMFCLQGKLNNTNGMKNADIMDAPVLRDLMIVLNLKLGQPAIDLNYGRIYLTTDADVDGSCISLQLMNFFSLWGDSLFDRIYRVLPPVYSCKKKNQPTKFYYTTEEYEKDKKTLTGYTIKKLKGLGSMMTPDYDEMINNPRLVKIKWDSDSNSYLEMAFGDNSQKRKDWLIKGSF